MNWTAPYSIWTWCLVLAWAALIVAAARALAISPKLRSWKLFVPRIATLAILLMVLAGPARRSQEQLPPEPASVVCLFDVSESMSLDRPASRLDRAKQALQRSLLGVAPDARPDLQLFQFGGELSAAASAAQLKAKDDATRLEEALRQLPSRVASAGPKAAIVFSDGAVESTADLQTLGEAYRKMSLPIHVFPVGDASIIGDVAVVQLAVPRRAEPGAKVPVRTAIRSTGFNGRRVMLRVRSQANPSRPALAELPLTLNGEVQTCELVVEVNPDVGRLILQVEPPQGDAIAANNQAPFQLTGRDRKIRVLYMEGTAGREYRWIRDALVEDPDIECEPMVVNSQYTQRPSLQRISDPYRGYPTTREELFKYDVVICSDISQGAFTREQINWTVDLVAERGGGFAMVGGHTSYGSGGWDRTAWDKLIPFDMTGRRDYLQATFRVSIPEEASTHPIWRLKEDAVENRQALSKMPPFYGTNLIARVKPAATLLGETSVSLPRVGVMAVFGCESFGRGRTFALSSDSTVAWGRDFESRWGEGDNRYFRKFWRNVVRWLSENSIAGSRRLHVETDKLIYRAGEPILLTAQAFDKSMNPTTDYELTVKAGSDEAKLAPMTADGASQTYRGEAEARSVAAEGASAEESVLQQMELRVKAAKGSDTVAESSVSVQILRDSKELLDVRPAPQSLDMVAKASGGQVLRTDAELRQVMSKFVASPGETLVHQTPLWDRWWLWAVLLALFSMEWTLRRRSGFG